MTIVDDALVAVRKYEDAARIEANARSNYLRQDAGLEEYRAHRESMFILKGDLLSKTVGDRDREIKAAVLSDTVYVEKQSELRLALYNWEIAKSHTEAAKMRVGILRNAIGDKNNE